MLTRNDFYREGHRRIFEAMSALAERSQPIDLVTLKDELIKGSALEGVGGAAYLASLLDGVPRITNVEHWSRIIKEKAVLRNLIHASTRIVQECYEAEDDPALLLDRAEKAIFDIAEHRIRQGFVGIREIVKESFRTIDQLSQSKELVTGIPTGFVDLDEKTSGLQKGDLVIVAARPAMGKTSLCLNIAQYASIKTGETVGIFSLEMAKEQLVLRMLCSDARVDSHRLRTGNLQEKDWARLAKAYADLSASHIFIDDSSTLTPLEMRAKCRRLKAEHGLGMVVVDYLQLMSGSGRVENRQQEIAAISRSMKGLAKELSVPVVALSQLSRAPETRTEKRPQLSDLRECVTGDTLVLLADGTRAPIASLVGRAPEVLSMDYRGCIVRARSEKVWKVGRRPVFEVRFASGRSMRGTAKHRLFGADGWVRVGDLKTGDRLAAARSLPAPANGGQEWPDSRVALLGQLIGDGSYLVHQPLRYTTESEANSRAVEEGALELGSTVKRYRGRRSWHQLLIGGNGNRWHPAGVNAWLRELGIHGQRSFQKRVPEAAFRLSDRQLGLLLRHLWATDGSMTVDVRSRKARIYYATTSAGLASDVAALLLRMGITARRYQAIKAGYRPSHHIIVSGAEGQRRFVATVGAFGPREPQAALVMALLGDVTSNANVDTQPTQILDRIRGLISDRGLSRGEVARRRGISHPAIHASCRYAPSRALVAEYAELLEDQILSERASDDLFWDRVVSVAPAGEEDVYDLTVPGPSSWLADGIVSHNSGGIEQDADIVMFIFREEEYKATDENRGIAEIIIGKQRNGPTGTVRLAFIKEFTRFENLEWRGTV